MKEKWLHIVDESSCPTAAELELYHSGKLLGEKRFAVENHLAGCEMCNDYLDGLSELTGSIDLDRVEIELKQEVRELLDKNNKQRLIPLLVQRLALAASILLLLGLTFYFGFYRNNEAMQVAQQIGQETSTQVEIGMETETLVPQNKIKQPEKAEPMAMTRPTPISKGIEDIKILTEAVKEVETIEDEVVMLEPFAVSEHKEELANDVMSITSAEKTKAIKKSSVTSGVVVDETGQALPGAVVMIKNRSEWVVSDESGSFEIGVLPGDSLRFSFVGYEPLIIPANNTMNVSMQPSEQILSEIKVTGYRPVKKRSVTATVAISTETRRLTLQERAKLKSIHKYYYHMPDSLKNEWLNTKYGIEVSLILKDNGAIYNLKRLLSITESGQKQDSIQKAIRFVEEEEYRKARRLIRELQE